jgi:hypothetical protein
MGSSTAETSDRISQAPPAQPDEPHPRPHLHSDSDDSPVRVSGDIDRNAREDTELARLRRNYSRASSSRLQGSSTSSRKPSTVLERLTYAVSRFWRHQVSITVEHSTCRDHLGMSCESFSPAPALQIKSSISSCLIGCSGSLIPNCQCTKSSGNLRNRFTTSFICKLLYIRRTPRPCFNSFIKKAEARAGSLPGHVPYAHCQSTRCAVEAVTDILQHLREPFWLISGLH